MVKKKHGDNERESYSRLRLPKKDGLEMFAIAKKMMGTDQVLASCEDGIERQCRISGKMKKRVWIREGDILIIKKWDFQPSKADIIWRYFGGQKNYLARKGLLKTLGIEE